MSKSQTLLPIISEKSMNLSEAENTYAFEVPRNFNKLQVKAAIQNQYDVEVSKVNMLNQRGKVKPSRDIRGRGQILGKRSDMKKAYVTLKSGDSIKIFQEGDS